MADRAYWLVGGSSGDVRASPSLPSDRMEVSKGSMPSMSNAREGDMSGEEVQQCLLDIASWLQSKAGAIGDDYVARAPATSAALAELPAAAPAALKVQ